MKNPTNQLFKDAKNYNLPKSLRAFDKLKCGLTPYQRIYWYYKEDKEFFEEQEEKVKNHYRDIYSGVIVPLPDTESGGGEIGDDELMVVIDTYPVEKENCQVDWVSIKRILDNEDLIEIFSRKSKRSE